MGEDVADLADADDLRAARDQPVEQGRLRRWYGVVAAVGGTLEGGGGLSDEGPGDDPADVQRVCEYSDDLAEFVEALQPEMVSHAPRSG